MDLHLVPTLQAVLHQAPPRLGCRRLRVDRHWLVLAVATLWVLTYGTRVEEARLRGLAPGRVRTPPLAPAVPRIRPLSLFPLGQAQVQQFLHRGYAWARIWLQPLPRPDPPKKLQWVDPPGSEPTVND